MAKAMKYLLVAALVLLVGYVLTVQVLRWIAFGDEEREALALMEQPLPVPEGAGGYKYIAFAGHAVPASELDDAFAREVAAFSAWHAAQGERIVRAELSGETWDVYASPVATQYPVRPAVPMPKKACGFREADCLSRLAGSEEIIRDWLESDTDRLELAWKAVRSDHLANPYPLGADTPIAPYQLFRLPMNAVALQALDGDIAGAQARACELLASSRRFLSHDGLLIDKMMNAAIAQGAAALVLGIRRLEPTAALPAECGVALEPVRAEDYFVCDSLRSEFAMMANFSRAQESALHGGWDPRRVAGRWLLVDDRLQRAWTARGLAPLCREQNRALIANGRVPQLAPAEFSKRSIDYWAAPTSSVLSRIASPAYVPYQRRLLDDAAVLRLQLAAIAHAGGELDADQATMAGASPGYALVRDDEGWRLPLLSNPSAEPEYRIRLEAAAPL